MDFRARLHLIKRRRGSRRRGRIGGERQRRRNELEELYLRPKNKHKPSSLNSIITIHFIIRKSALLITKGWLKKRKECTTNHLLWV